MHKQEATSMGTLAEDARALMTPPPTWPGKKVGEARKRLAATLERGKEIYGRVREEGGRRRQSRRLRLCASILIKPSASPSGWGRLSATWFARLCAHKGD